MSQRSNAVLHKYNHSDKGRACRSRWQKSAKGKAAANKQYRLNPRKRVRIAERLRRQRAAISELKAIPCADCGLTYPSYVMDFDHVRGEKLFCVSQGTYRPMAVLLDEIAKCDVVCANCHRRRTHEPLT